MSTSGGIWSRYFIQIMLANALAYLGMQMINTTVVPYAIWLGTAASLAGILSGVSFICALLARPVSGLCTNHMDKRRLLLVSIVLVLLGSVGLSCTTALPLILFTRALQGVGYAFVSTLCMAIVADFLPPDRIGKGIGYFGLSICIAQMAGPALGLWLTAQIGYPAAYLVTSVFFVVGFLCAYFLPPMPAETKLPFNLPLLSPGNLIATESLLPATVGLLFSILNSCLSAFLAVYASSKGIDSAGTFFVVSASAMFLSRLLGANTADRRSLAFTGAVSGTLLITSMLLLGFGFNLWTMLAAAAVFGIGYGFLLPVTQSRSVSAPPPEKHGTGSSTYFIGIDLGFSIGNVAGGFLVQHVGPANMYLCLIVPAVAAMILCLTKGHDR